MNKKTILIVDDDSELRKNLSDILKAKGCVPMAVETGKQALDMAKKQIPYVALIDLKLKDMSGLNVIKKIKEFCPGTECIIFTAYTSKKSAIEAVNLGAYSYVQKPYDMDQLLMMIQRAIDKRKAEEALRIERDNWHNIFESIEDGIYIVNQQYDIQYVNPALVKIFGPYEGQKCYKYFHDRDEICTRCKNQYVLAGKTVHWEWYSSKNRMAYDLAETPIILPDGIIGKLVIFRDITERKKLEAQFIQAQKMEAIGTLTGGIAHDFNNLLTAIIGNAELALVDMDKNNPSYEYIQEMKNAGENAASLTRQLLAFSRKQVINPRVLDLNQEINQIKRMIWRLIGEDIEFLTVLEPELWKVHTDPGQISQVIMNLAVNARDAMPRGGKITIKTSNVDLDKDFFHDHGVGEQPGPYVMFTVSDTGMGMDKETLSRIFEPFFTTKERGGGTGLGLSTVYGIVKQNSGYIWAYSELGRGTTFEVYLPKIVGDRKLDEKERAHVAELNGSETVLIVEDDDKLRNLALKILKRHGYRVLEAQDGEGALKVCKEHEGQVHLLLTDVVMPKMSGKEVAEKLQSLRPETKVIYMSGYLDNSIARHGVLAQDVNFIPKPFSPKDLARIVREVLDREIDD